MIAPGLEVCLHYTLSVDGEVHATSRGTEPLEFVHGTGALVPGLERALTGRRAGERFTVLVEARDGYGERIYFGPQRIERSMLPENAEIQAGMRVKMKKQDGEPAEFWVTKVEEDAVWMDYEHPLVGKTLRFEVEILRVGDVDG